MKPAPIDVILQNCGGKKLLADGFLWRILQAIFVWLCFIRLPTTGLRDSVPQSWEGVLSYSAAHRLQWGHDIVFTFGPLGFLTSDYYWGNFFWPIVLWGFGFSLGLTSSLVPLLTRGARSARLIVFFALPMFTVPACQNLGFDPVYLLFITLLGTACLPAERPGLTRLISTGVIFAVMSLIKFTFSLYCGYALLVVAAAWSLRGAWRNAGIMIASWLAAFFLCWELTGQNLASIPLHFVRSFQLAAGYSSAMAIPGDRSELILGFALLLGLVTLLLTRWLSCEDWRHKTDAVAIIGAGIFLAWKEGFVRPDVHVVVFFIYSFFLAVLLPALLGPSRAPETARATVGGTPLPTESPAPIAFAIARRPLLFLTMGMLLVSLTPFALHQTAFAKAARTGFVAKISDNLTALFAPAVFRRQLERELDSRRTEAALPRIRALLAGERVAVMSHYQDVAILNGLNYAPHPIFQSYCAYTPELQRLNEAFFDSDEAPPYVLWRSETIDSRFPTLDNGEVILKVLSEYSPVMREDTFILWRRNSQPIASYSLANPRELKVALDQWIPIRKEPTWLRVELRQTWLGKIQSLLLSGSQAQLEIRREHGKNLHYLLVPGNARHGFVLSPFLQSDADLIGSNSGGRVPDRICAVRISSFNKYFFNHSIRVVTQTIGDIPTLQLASTVTNAEVTFLKE